MVGSLLYGPPNKVPLIFRELPDARSTESPNSELRFAPLATALAEADADRPIPLYALDMLGPIGSIGLLGPGFKALGF